MHHLEGPIGHHLDAAGHSAWRVFAPLLSELTVVLPGRGEPAERVPLRRDEAGWWHGGCGRRLGEGTRYWLDVAGQRTPDPATRAQPEGVHGPSAVAHITPVRTPGWRGVKMADAVIYELHLGTFTPEGTLRAAIGRLPHLAALGVNVVELMPVAAFPGERNWGYDGVCLYALHGAYGSWADLHDFIAAAHALGLAVILDVVYNHFGPEGNYSGRLAPYTKAAPTPWGAAVNVDMAWNHGVRAFFLENLRFWLEDVGFDGVRMDAVSMIFDSGPLHILRACTDVARAVGARQGRTVLTIAEHLRNDRGVTSADGLGYDAQWNDDLNHAVFAHLTGETAWRHYANFGAFDDVLRALRDAFVLDGTRFDRYLQYYVGTDGRGTAGHEHVVHLQNHDQVGNRPRGDRLVATYGRARAMLGAAIMMASPFVPMLWMGEEYGETAPFLFFEDFGDPQLVAAVQAGRAADFGFDAASGAQPGAPHDRATFEASRLDWSRAETEAGRAMLAWYRGLIALKRRGALGPRERAQVQVEGDAARGLLIVRAPHTLTLLNLRDRPCALGAADLGDPPASWRLALASVEPVEAAEPALLAPWGARVYERG